jgi:hypothetical protein
MRDTKSQRQRNQSEMIPVAAQRYLKDRLLVRKLMAVDFSANAAAVS